MKLGHQLLLHCAFEVMGSQPSLTLAESLKSIEERLKKEEVDLGMTGEQVAEVVTKVWKSKEGTFGPLNAFVGGYLA